MFTGREHGDDNVGVVHRTLGVGDDLHAVFRGSLARRRHHVEAAHTLARLDQIGGHRPAHVAETDKSNVRHGKPRSYGNCNSKAPTGLKWRSTIPSVTSSSRTGCHAGLRSLSTMVARMPSMKSCPAMHASAIR